MQCKINLQTGHDVNFCSDLPRRASEIQFSLALLQLSLALEKFVYNDFIIFHLKPSRTWFWHVRSIFPRTSLDGRPRNLHTFSKVNLKYTKRTFPVGQARCSFHLPHSYNLQILLDRGNGASTNVEPWQT